MAEDSNNSDADDTPGYEVSLPPQSPTTGITPYV